MAYRPHILTTWGGQRGTSDEIWSNSLRWVTNGTDPAALQDLAIAWNPIFSAALLAHVPLEASGYDSSTFVDWIKINAVGADGKQYSQTTNVMYAGEHFTRTAGTRPPGPFQLATVISFTTAIQRGRAARGRLFVPCGYKSAGFDGGTGLMAAGDAQAMATQWAAFIEDLDNNEGPDFADLRAAVLSPLGTDPGNWREIRGCRVGRVYDTQRRRRNQLSEQYGATVTIAT